MLNEVKLTNFGPLTRLDWSNLGHINLAIGHNGSGKTFLLKSLYSAMRTLEEYKRGDDRRTETEILADKLEWTFQPDKIGDLVSKGADAPLSCAISFDQNEFSYSFGKDTTKQISTMKNLVPAPRNGNSIFLPAKEVLSLHSIILKSRERDQMFGFDDTYFDLARALRQPTMRGYMAFANVRDILWKILGGKVKYDETSNHWQFVKGNQKFSIGVTAEGIKKIAILETLLDNRYLTPDSIVFIDEPESALHPTAISQFLDIVAELAKRGIQFFLASHSYFVVKKLYLIAQKEKMSVPVISLLGGDRMMRREDLIDGMPDNPIIDESIRLYKEEVGLALQ